MTPDKNKNSENNNDSTDGNTDSSSIKKQVKLN